MALAGGPVRRGLDYEVRTTVVARQADPTDEQPGTLTTLLETTATVHAHPPRQGTDETIATSVEDVLAAAVTQARECVRAHQEGTTDDIAF